ncbi:MAG: outer membrane beta-barrel protein [Acetobacterales bacterium]
MTTAPARGDTVAGRARPEYDPAGIRMGGFFFYPSFALAEIYRDNIFYEDDDPESDFETVATAAVKVGSNWNNHALNFYGDVNVGRFLDNDIADYEDFRVGTNGRLDIQRDLSLAGGLVYERLHEDRSSPEQGADEPTIYTRYGPDVALTKRFNRLVTQVGGSMLFFDYDDVTTVNGVLINNDDRDRTVSTGFGRVGYEFSPNYQAFVRVSGNDRTYEDDVDDNGLSRDSQGWEAVGGVALDLGGLVFGELFAGYLSQDYDAAQLDRISSVSFGGEVTWNVTPLTTIVGSLSRAVEETTIGNASGALATNAGVSVDHELLRHVIVSADASYRTVEFENIDRDDDIMNVGVGARYLLNRNVNFQVRLSHAERDSTSVNNDYEANTALLRIVLQR